MSKKNRYLAATLSIILAMLLLAACNNFGATSNGGNSKSPGTSQTGNKTETPVSFSMMSRAYGDLVSIHEDAEHGEEINAVLANMAPTLLSFTGATMAETMLMLSNDGDGKYNVNGTYGEIDGNNGKLVRTDDKAVYEKNTAAQGSMAAHNDKAEFIVADAQCQAETDLFEDGSVYRHEVSYMKYKDGAVVGFHQYNTNGLKRQGDDAQESAVVFFILTDKQIDLLYAYNENEGLDKAFFAFDHTKSIADMKDAFTTAGYKITADQQLKIS